MPCSTCPLLHGPSVLEDDDRTGHGRDGISMDAMMRETGEDFSAKERTGRGSVAETRPNKELDECIYRIRAVLTNSGEIDAPKRMLAALSEIALICSDYTQLAHDADAERMIDAGLSWSDVEGFLRWVAASGEDWKTACIVFNRILFDDQTFAKQAARFGKTRQAIHARLERAKQRSIAVRKFIEIAQQRRSVE